MQAENIHELDAIPQPVRQQLATVREMIDGGWLLDDNGRQLMALRAAGCLLAPAVGDRVLAISRGEEAWILAVLWRDSGDETVLEAPGNLTLKAACGKISVEGSEGLDLSSEKQVSVNTPCFQLRAGIADVFTGKLDWLAQKLNAKVDGVSFVGRMFDSIVERFSRKARWSFRDIDGMDQTRAGQIDCRAEANMVLRGGNVIAKAANLAKVDGKQIHMG